MPAGSSECGPERHQQLPFSFSSHATPRPARPTDQFTAPPIDGSGGQVEPVSNRCPYPAGGGSTSDGDMSAAVTSLINGRSHSDRVVIGLKSAPGAGTAGQSTVTATPYT